MTAVVLRGDARQLPLPDGCVDLIVTSPPYWVQRDYRDNGASMPGQIGSEPTWQQWLAAMIDCTREWIRVLKPDGNLFVNLGDKMINKRMLLLPARYEIACTDQLGLIARRDIIWSKPNGLPESVTDRCRTSHEYVFHLVKQPRYYAAVDEIREPGTGRGSMTWEQRKANGEPMRQGEQRRTFSDGMAPNPLGKLPGSVWPIPSAPLVVPAHLGVDHFAAFPPALVRPLVLGWSPPGVCTGCGQGRRPVKTADLEVRRSGRTWDKDAGHQAEHGHNWRGQKPIMGATTVTITGYECSCSFVPSHVNPVVPNGRPVGLDAVPDVEPLSVDLVHDGNQRRTVTACPPPTRPALVLDPFAGTGTTMLVASAYGRVGVGVDRSMDYARLARWRCSDPRERARARDMPKPPPVPEGMETLF